MTLSQHPDLHSIAEARELAERAAAAQKIFAGYDQEAVDAVVDAMAMAARGAAADLGRRAFEETGFGDPDCKREKNLFCAERVHAFIRPMRTVGVLREDAIRKVYEIAEPVGVVAAILPSTNPTSTAIYKALIAVKARNGLVASPHPAARESTLRTMAILREAARAAGAPEGLLGCIEHPSGEATHALMRDRHIGVILATGGSELVRAAYSSGKPCFGVGPGNVPVYVHQSALPAEAVAHVIRGKLFDNGTLCSSEQAMIVDRVLSDAVIKELAAQGAHFLSADEQERLGAALFTARGTVNPKLLGRPATRIAEACSIRVAQGTRLLVAPLSGVGRDHPLSAEKLSPVLAYYVVDDWRRGCERCTELLAFGGAGHTLGIHARDRDVIFRFALEKPAFRIIVNAPTATGAVGLDTGLDPAMTLGCGSMGGNITSDNISPIHLINVKRVAFGSRDTLVPGIPAWVPRATAVDGLAAAPRAAPPANVAAVPPADLRARLERFLDRQGMVPSTPGPPAASGSVASAPRVEPEEPACDFVCEDDVRRAIREGRRIRVDARTIVTPAARDLAQGAGVLHRE